jgi:hypothetical protein
MDEPQLLWRFGRWIARRGSGAARLAWSGGEMRIQVLRGKLYGLEGPPVGMVASRLAAEPAGRQDLVDEALELARRRSVGENQALGVVKSLFAEGLRCWIVDPERELEIEDGLPVEREGPTISLTHAMVELILADESGEPAKQILPDLDVLLRRHPSFLELYSPLRLAEEADLIVAKITGQRTAREVIKRTPHVAEEVVRLLAALVASGMLEPVQVVESPGDRSIVPDEMPPLEPESRQLPIKLIVGVAFAVVILLGTIGLLLSRSEGSAPASPTPVGQEWSVVIDLACESNDYQRVQRKRSQQPRPQGRR